MPITHLLDRHYEPRNFSDRIAYAFVGFLRFFADTFFASRYGHRAVVLETVAAVPGMVGGALQHLQSLRRIEADYGRIRLLLSEAENERMHLMTFIQITQPSGFERLLIWLAQGVFFNLYFLLYLISQKTAGLILIYVHHETVRPKPNRPEANRYDKPSDLLMRRILLKPHEFFTENAKT